MLARRAHLNNVGIALLQPHHVGCCWSQRRGLKTLDVREYKPFAVPLEFRAYQRYTLNPVKKAGVIFNTHFNTNRRYDVYSDPIDYLWWGKENGQAQLPHRHQRVAFDFHDAVHPTATLPGTKHPERYFRGQDPSEGLHPDLASGFNPYQRPFSQPQHWNTAFSSRRAHTGSEGHFRYGRSFAMYESSNMQYDVTRTTDTLPTVDFGNSLMPRAVHMYSQSGEANRMAHTVSNVPGLDKPYLGEKDRKMMQAMSSSCDELNSVTMLSGRFSSHIFLNRPSTHNKLGPRSIKSLSHCIDRETNGITRKMVTLTAAQSGETDYFCAGLDLQDIAEQIALCHSSLADAKRITKAADAKQHDDPKVARRLHHEAECALQRAADHRSYVDITNRDAMQLLWHMFSAPRSLQTIINGRCKNVGVGLALLCKFPGLRDSTELVHDGPNMGITPFGSMTHLLSRTEVSLKYPGLAEFIMMTGAPLYAGDALRLGWSDLFSTLPDINYHTKEWFDESEHMHNDAVAWQTDHLLDTCWKMKDDHSIALERTSLSQTRARWIEDVFADQPSVSAIMSTLTAVEKLPLSDPNNTTDTNSSAVFSLSSVDVGLDTLESHNMRFAYAPWESCDVEAAAAAADALKDQAGTFFTQYFLERRGTRVVATSKVGEMAKKWNEQRKAEFTAYKLAKVRAHPRHVFVRLEGCENKIVEFDFEFDKEACVRALGAGATAEQREVVMLEMLKRRIMAELQMPLTRAVELGWCLPTFDTAPIHDDEDVFAVLHNDPGIEAPTSAPTSFPPLYLTVRRCQLHFSEWAYAVKHQMLLASPFALKAAFQMLNQVRGDGSEAGVQSVSESLATEFRYLTRTQQRPDFFAIGVHTTKPIDDFKWNDQRAKTHVHEENPLRPIPTFAEVFEKDVVLDGHKFLVRPRWQPRTLEEVDDSEIAKLAKPLSFGGEGVTEVCVPLLKKLPRVDFMVEEAGGLEVVPGLGEKDASGKPLAPSEESNAVCPNNVSFYRMARHPWMDIETSWRIDGFTEGSHEYFLNQHKKADAAVYDPENKGTRTYWPPKERLQAVDSDEEALLQDRLWNVISSANRNVENWARELRTKVGAQSFDYVTEVAQPSEKVFDDEYYRWFIRPGVHPNPTGILRGGVAAPRAAAATSDAGTGSADTTEEEVVDFEGELATDNVSEPARGEE